jgi:hypothetical protein
MTTTAKERCGFRLENDYDEDREDRVCQRIVTDRVWTVEPSKVTGKPITRRVCGRCFDVLTKRYENHGIEYDHERVR